MPEPLRAAVLGLSHDHVWWNIPGLQKSDEIRVVAAADPHPALLEQFAGVVPDAARYADPSACLDAVQPDLVLCCDSNAACVGLVELAAERGIHCVVEKPMANSLAGADRMAAACRRAGVHLIINWPTAWSPAFWHAGKLAASGDYGPIWQISYRSAHNGPREIGCSPYFVEWLYDPELNGPAAYMDYCCYGAVTSRWLLGVPESVTASAGKLVKGYDLACDNAVLLLRYPHALCLIQASWTQVAHVPFVGAIFCCERAALRPHGNTILVCTAECPDGEPVEAEPPPAPLRSLGHYTAAIVRGGLEPVGILDPRLARDAQAILEAGWLAAQTGTAQSVPA